jgi:hypothetical protein
MSKAFAPILGARSSSSRAAEATTSSRHISSSNSPLGQPRTPKQTSPGRSASRARVRSSLRCWAMSAGAITSPPPRRPIPSAAPERPRHAKAVVTSAVRPHASMEKRSGRAGRGRGARAPLRVSAMIPMGIKETPSAALAKCQYGVRVR